jgi:hypothetical protein
MPLETQPLHPLPKGPRPGSRTPPHTVTDDETLESVAKKFGVSVHHLVTHNFGTTNEREINWYLNHYVGCTLPTRDGKNWRFSRAAHPGLIYIPITVHYGEPIMVYGHVPRVDLGDRNHPLILSTNEFVHEFRFPAEGEVEMDSFLLSAAINIVGTLKQAGGLSKISLRKDQVKLAIEKKLTDVTTLAFGVKFDDKLLTPVADALKNGSTEGLGKALAGAFEVSVKSAYRFGRFAVVPEFGLQLQKTFILLRLSFEWQDVVFIENVPFQVKGAVKLALNIGLSRKGWAEVAKKVGPQALRSYLAKGGRTLGAVGEWLLTEGVLVTAGAAGVAGTFGLLALRSWVVGKAIQKAMLQALGTWYLSAYVATVFNGQMPFGSTTGWPQDQIRLRDDLVTRAPRDAVADARAFLLVAGDPAARGSDSDALSAWRMALTAQQNGRADRAEAQLRQALEPRVRGILGY